MNILISENLREKILKLLDKKYFDSYEKDGNPNFTNLKDKAILEDEIVVYALNTVYSIADFMTVTESIKKSSYKDTVEELSKKMKDGIQPQDGWDYELPQDEENFGKLIEQLNTVIQVLEIGDEVILAEKDRKRISDDIINSINFAIKNDIALTKNEIEQFEKIKIELTEQYENKYPNIQLIESSIDRYNNIANSIWDAFLNDSNNKIVHIGIIDGEYNGNILSTSLITENETATFTYNGEGVGMLIKPKKIIAADSKDVKTNNSSSYVENANTRRVHLKLPQQIEQEIIEKTIEKNGENLNYTTNNMEPIYSEVVLSDYEITGYVMIGYGDKTQTSNCLKLQNAAKSKNMDFEYIDINSLRECHGLLPISSTLPKVSTAKLGKETLSEQKDVEFIDEVNSIQLAGERDLINEKNGESK